MLRRSAAHLPQQDPGDPQPGTMSAHLQTAESLLVLLHLQAQAGMVEVAHPVPWQAQLEGRLTVQAHLLQGLQWGSGQLLGLRIQLLALRSMGSIDLGGF